jgi:hypothetical protein
LTTRHFLSVGVLALFLGLAGGSDASKQGGTQLGNQMDGYAVEYIAEQGLLEEGETVLVWYDVTIALDGSEAALVTNERVIYHKAGRNSSIALADIVSIDTQDAGAMGDIIDVTAADGSRMRIEVAPLNGGDLFVSELERAWSNAQ